MSSIQIKGTTTTTTTSNLNHTTTVAQVHTPMTNATRRENMHSSNFSGQRVRSVSNGRTPEGLKMNKYTGNILQGEKTIVPLAQRRRANHITSEFISSNGLRKATNIRRGEIPTQKVYGVGIPSEIYKSPSQYTKARGPIQEMMASPKSPVGEFQTTSGGLGVLTRGGIKYESGLISRPAGQNHLISMTSRETGTRILNQKGYQGTTHVPRVGTNRYASPPRHTNSGLAVSRILNNRQFSPVPPHIDGSPRKTNPVTYDQVDGLMIDVGGTKMDVRGSKGNSPVPQTRRLQGEYRVENSIRSRSPGFVRPGKGTNLTTEGVRTIGGGLDSMRPGTIRGGITEVSGLGVTNTVTVSSMSGAKSPVRTSQTFGDGTIKVGSNITTGRTTGTYTGGGIISRKIAGTRGLSYI